MVSILVTGFGEFLQHKRNPSKLLVESLAERLRSGSIVLSQPLHTMVLPVSYERATKALLQQVSSHVYSHVLMTGLASGRQKVSWERFATNWVDSESPDMDGAVRIEESIVEGSALAVRSPYPLRRWEEKAKSLGLPIEISTTAGSYVCNFISYSLGEWISRNSPQTGWMFYHVPHLTNESDPGVPNLSWDEQVRSLEFTLKEIDALKS